MPLHPSTAAYRCLAKTAASLAEPEDGDRYLDLGVEIRIVEKDQNGVSPPDSGLPRLVEVADPIRIGGRYDTLARRFVGECHEPAVWLVGERQADILLRRDPEKSRVLLYSAEGAGKTVLAAQWAILQVLLLATAGEKGAIGATAPTTSRLGSLRTAITDLVPIDLARERRPGAWGTLYTDASEIRMATGHCIQLRATQRQSAAAGSPIQGYTWKAVVADEMQDQVEQGVYPDLEARLRGAKTSYIMATSTAKDSAAWRDWRDALSDHWQIERLSYTDTPFVHDEHWARMKDNVSDREWKRRGLALDVPPELQTYTSWSREYNLRPVPTIGAKDVTATVQGRFARGVGMLVGYDPGQICDVSLFIQFFKIRGLDAPAIWVRDEVTTDRTTTEEHIVAVKRRLVSKWGMQTGYPDDPRALVRIDPYGDTDSKTDRSVYHSWRGAGFDARSAAFKNGKGSGRIPKEAGIEMVNRLLCSAAGTRRLFVDVDDRGRPVAPRLVEALELSERDLAGKAEMQRKGKKDLSHWPAALRYALWATERTRSVDTLTMGRAV